MSVIPGTISFDDMKPQQKATKVTKKRVTNEVPKQGSDFFIKGEDRLQELEAMEYEIGGFADAPEPAPAPAPAPVEEAKPVKKKRKMSEKQLAHLAKMRASKAAKRAARQTAQPKAAPAPAPKAQKTDEEKAAKRARKRAEMKDYFNELYGEKEKVRMAAKEKRRAEKQAIYQKLIASGQLNIGRQVAPPTPAPSPAPVVPLGKKRVRWNGLELETYYE